MIDLPPNPADYSVVSPALSPKDVEHRTSLGSSMVKAAVVPAFVPIKGFSITNCSILNGAVTLSWTPTNNLPVQIEGGNGGVWYPVGMPTTNRTTTFQTGNNHYWRLRANATNPPSSTVYIPFVSGAEIKLWAFQPGDATATAYSVPGWSSYPGWSDGKAVTIADGSVVVSSSGQGTTPVRVAEFWFDGGALQPKGVDFTFGNSTSRLVIAATDAKEVVLASWNEPNVDPERVDFAYRDSTGRWSTLIHYLQQGRAPECHAMAIGGDGLIYYFAIGDGQGATIHLVRLKRQSDGLHVVDEYSPFINCSWNDHGECVNGGPAAPMGELPILDARFDASRNCIWLAYQQQYGTTNMPSPPYTPYYSLASHPILTKVTFGPTPQFQFMAGTSWYGLHISGQRVFTDPTGPSYLIKASEPTGAQHFRFSHLDPVNNTFGPWTIRDDVPGNYVPAISDNGYWVESNGRVHYVGPFTGQERGSGGSG